MKIYYALLIIPLLSGCLMVSHEEDLPPLRWQSSGTFSTDVELTASHRWSIVINAYDKAFAERSQLADLEVKFTVINRSKEPAPLFWRADNEEEKQAGEISMEYEEYEMRKILLKPGKKLVWYVGKMEELVSKRCLSVVNVLDTAKRWKLFFQLEFKDPERLKELVNVSELEIPLSARFSDGV